MMRVLVLPSMCMHGAFAAGALAGLETIGISANYFKAIIGTSSGGWNGAYSLTGQLPKEGLRLWAEHVPNGFLQWRRCRPYADLAYLEHITRYREALDIRRLHKSKTDLFATVTDMETRNAYHVHLNAEVCPIPYLIAGSAIPILSKPQKINGRCYGDGALTNAIPIRFAENLGADEIWIILNTPEGHRNSWTQWKIISLFAQSGTERELLVASIKQKNKIFCEIEQRSDLRVIRPRFTLPISRFTRDPQEMRFLIEMGRKAALKNIRAM